MRSVHLDLWNTLDKQDFLLTKEVAKRMEEELGFIPDVVLPDVRGDDALIPQSDGGMSSTVESRRPS